METKIVIIIISIQVTAFFSFKVIAGGICSPNCGEVPVITTGTTCNETTGECLYGCKGNFTGEHCDSCKREWTGDKCQFKCDYDNCLNCTWTNDSGGQVQIGCDLCHPNYFYTPKKCEYCSDGCLRNSTSNLPRCDQRDGSCTFGCKQDRYGSRCSDPCPDVCVNSSCTRAKGCCSEGCRYPQFAGCQCVEPCNSNCLNGTCYHNKTCRLGCKTGYWGSSCQQSCSTTCNNTLDNSTSSCDVSGHCVLGCKKTYMGAQCERRCNEACFDGDCHQDSGICVKGCIKGYYGQICNQTCNSNCYKTDCYHSNGTCKMCLAGFHGFFCAKRCPENCLNKVCSQDDGVCLKGCVKGMSGPQCDTAKPKVSTEDKTFLNGILDLALYTFSGLAGLVLVGIVIFILWKRRKAKIENSHACEIAYENLEMPTAKGIADTEGMDSQKKYTGEQYEEITTGFNGSIHLYEDVKRRSRDTPESAPHSKRFIMSYKTLQEQDISIDRPVIHQRLLNDHRFPDDRDIGDQSVIDSKSSQNANSEKALQGQITAGGYTKSTSSKNQSIFIADKDKIYENLELRRKSKLK